MIWSLPVQVQVVRLDNNQLTGSIPKLADTIMLLNASSNQLTGQPFQNLPATLEVLYLAQNSLTGVIPENTSLPVNLTILDLAHNALSGTLPQALPRNLTVFNASNNALSDTLPDCWTGLTELMLDNNNVHGNLPAAWSTWGSSTNNSIQMSVQKTALYGGMPRQWVEQFCLAVVTQSSERVLFTPAPFRFRVTLGLASRQRHYVDVLVQTGCPIVLMAQHSSINVTLDGRSSSFSYHDPDSLCSVPNAVRNTAILWGLFAAVMLGAIIGHGIWVKKAPATPGWVRKISVLASSSSLDHKKVKLSKRVATVAYIFLSDVMWFLYSQITDALAISQLFSLHQLKYAYILLAILLLPFLGMLLLVARVAVQQALVLLSVNAQHSRSYIFVRKAAAFLGGAIVSPFIWFVLEVRLMLEGIGIPVPKRLALLPKYMLFEAFDLMTMYRAKSIMETLFNALLQAVIQSKLYIMGNNPNGTHVYINTTLFLSSVAGSLLDIVKTVALMLMELHHFKCGIFTYNKKLVKFVSFEEYRGLQQTVGEDLAGHVPPNRKLQDG